MHTLPLSTYIKQRLPRAVYSLLSPFIARIATIEAAINTSSHWPTLILLLSTLIIIHQRKQYRAIITATALIEPITRSLSLLRAIELNSDNDKERERVREETKHLTAFFLFLATIQLVESITTSSTPSASLSLITRTQSAITAIAAKTRFTKTKPTLPRQRTPFPQPKPLPTVSTYSQFASTLAQSNPNMQPTTTTFLPAHFIPSDLHYRIIKTLLLWTAARTDQWGAATLWDLIASPIWSVAASRTPKRKYFKVVVIEDTPSTSNENENEESSYINVHLAPKEGGTTTALSSDRGEEDHTTTVLSESPITNHNAAFVAANYHLPPSVFSTSSHQPYTLPDTYSTQDEVELNSSFDSGFSPSPSSISGSESTSSPRIINAHLTTSPKFPTPQVPYRIASSTCPIRGATKLSSHSFNSPSPAPSSLNPNSSTTTLEPLALSTATLTTNTIATNGKRPSVDIKRYLQDLQQAEGSTAAGWSNGVGGSW